MTEPDGQIPGRDHRRELGFVVVLALLGGGTALLAASRVWLVLSTVRPAPFGPLTVNVHGRTEFAAVAGFSVVILLAAVLILVTGRWARTALGMLMALSAIALGRYGVAGLHAPGPARLRELLGGTAKAGGGPISVGQHAFWPATVLLGAALTLLAGVLVILRARRWSTGLSARYDAPVEAGKTDDPWRQLDRGEDPTIADG